MRISFHPCSLHRMACTDPSIGDEGLGDCNGRRLTAVYYLNKGITHSCSTLCNFCSVVMVGNVQKMSSGNRQVCKEECQCIDVFVSLVVFLLLINVLLCVVGFLRIHRTPQLVIPVNQSLGMTMTDTCVFLPAKVMVDTYASWVNVVVYMILVSDGGQPQWFSAMAEAMSWWMYSIML